MLKIITGIAILFLIAFIGYRVTFVRLRLPAGARLLFLTGTEFIFVGLALGSDMIGILDEETLRSLTPLFGMGLGFIGLLFGIQLDFRRIALFPRRFFLISLIQAAVTVVVVFLPFYFLLDGLFEKNGSLNFLAALMLAATAACTAPTSLALLSREFRLTGARVMELLRYVASLDALVGLTTFGLVFCLLHARSAPGDPLWEAAWWFALSIALGAAVGFLLHFLTQVRCSDEEMFIFVTGAVVFSGGIAMYLMLSPLFVNMVMGITMANLGGTRNRIFNLLIRLEKPFYIVFLIMAGAAWRIGPLWSLLIAALYITLRFLGKVAGSYVAMRVAGRGLGTPKRLGLGLISQGGVVIAMVMNWYQVAPSDLTDVMVTAVLIAVILNELISPSLTRSLLERAGEIQQ